MALRLSSLAREIDRCLSVMSSKPVTGFIDQYWLVPGTDSSMIQNDFFHN